MRNLKDWLGHKVLVLGVINKIEPNSYCITNVRVKEYSLNPEIREIDHINTFFTEREMEVYDELKKRHPKKVPKLNEKVGFVGRVIKYTRRNGTVDYGIESIPTISFSITGKKGAKIPAKEREKLVLEMIFLLKKKEIFYDFEKQGHEKYLNELDNLLSHIRWELAVIRYSHDKAIESMKKTRRGNLNPDPVRFKSRRLESACGFR
jgi:hypothetical protein